MKIKNNIETVIRRILGHAVSNIEARQLRWSTFEDHKEISNILNQHTDDILKYLEKRHADKKEERSYKKIIEGRFNIETLNKTEYLLAQVDLLGEIEIIVGDDKYKITKLN